MMVDEASTIEPVRKSITVKKSPRDAFALWTEGIASWWPLVSHSVHELDAETCVFESKMGGRIYERSKKGEVVQWGTVTAWEPPSRVAYEWHPGYGRDEGQLVEVRFTEIAQGTRVDLVHTGWEKLGARARKVRDGYETGWDLVFGKCYGTAA